MNKNKYIHLTIAFVLFVSVFILPSCKKDTVAVPPSTVANSISEAFNSISAAQAKGWLFINNSKNLGATTWQAGNGTLFAGHTTDAAASDYVSIVASCSYPFDSDGNFDATTEISAWMITPVLTVKNGDVLSFYTRTTDVEAYIPERLELRMNATGTGTDVGSDTASVGDFTKTVLSINPQLNFGEFPTEWKQFQYTVTGISTETKTRFAFHYYKPVNTLGAASFYYELGYVGIDDFLFDAQ